MKITNVKIEELKGAEYNPRYIDVIIKCYIDL